MNEKIVAGDVVQLKSGGERMTVESIDDTEITCVWFEGKQPQRAKFLVSVLRKAKPMVASMKLTRG